MTILYRSFIQRIRWNLSCSFLNYKTHIPYKTLTQKPISSHYLHRSRPLKHTSRNPRRWSPRHWKLPLNVKDLPKLLRLQNLLFQKESNNLSLQSSLHSLNNSLMMSDSCPINHVLRHHTTCLSKQQWVFLSLFHLSLIHIWRCRRRLRCRSRWSPYH